MAVAPKSLVAALLCVPFAAHAGKLVVEYTGVVSSIDRASLAEEPPYAVGDPNFGTLIIDTALAPADTLLLDPQIGRYYGHTPGVDFILGPKHPDGNGPGDLVLGSQWPSSSEQILADDSLSQSVVVEREPGTNLWGYIERGFGKFWQIVSVTVDRLSMKPRVGSREQGTRAPLSLTATACPRPTRRGSTACRESRASHDAARSSIGRGALALPRRLTRACDSTRLSRA